MREWILDRLEEPSTWYGLGVVLAGAFSHLAPTEWSSFLAGFQYVAGGLAVVTSEKH